MPDRVNRRDLIMQTAARLFESQGYYATSTRQIAEAVGCTEAAIYYHFKDGKRELLHAVMEARMPEIQAVLDRCRQTASLKDVMRLFGETFAEHTPGMRWLMMELPHLSAEEQDLILGKFLSLREGLAATLEPFVPEKAQADHLAWLLVCVGEGYQQLFSEIAFRDQFELSMTDLMETLASLMA